NLVDNLHVFSEPINLKFFVVLLVPLFNPLQQRLFIQIFTHFFPLLKPVWIRKHSSAANSENRSSNLARRTEPKPNCSRNVCNANCSNRSYASCTSSTACLTVMRLSRLTSHTSHSGNRCHTPAHLSSAPNIVFGISQPAHAFSDSYISLLQSFRSVPKPWKSILTRHARRMH